MSKFFIIFIILFSNGTGYANLSEVSLHNRLPFLNLFRSEELNLSKMTSKKPFIGEDGKYHYIYLTTNSINNKKYLGKHSHRSYKNTYLGCGVYSGNSNIKTSFNGFPSAIIKYGADSFNKRILLFFSTKELAFRGESLLGEILKVKESEDFYNIMKCGSNGYRKPIPQEVKDKISKAHKGKFLSERTKNRISISNIGRVCSDITKSKIGKANSGKIRSEEVKTNLSNKLKGRIIPEETRAKYSVYQKNRTYYSDEFRRKLRIANTGRVQSEESKQKNREAHLGNKWSDKTREKFNHTMLNTETVKCSFCGKLDKIPIINRWHNENCKKNPDYIDKREELTCPYCGFKTKSKGAFNLWHNDNCKFKNG